MKGDPVSKKIHALSTIDNPFDPFDEFEKWRMFDIDNHYFCCERQARNSFTSDAFTEEENEEEIERAIDEIILNDPLNIYCKKTKIID